MTAPFAAVIGWPANHSLSPVMMRRWLDDAGMAGDYGRLEITTGHFERVCRSLPELGWAGANITLPHKSAALAAADAASEAARQVGAANLITVGADGRLTADNTDIAGIATALDRDKGAGPAVLIGAGGAAAAALHHLAAQDREIRLVNRTKAKAEALAARYRRPIAVSTDLDASLRGACLVVNATSLGMAGQPALEPDLSSTDEDALIFDMVYAPLKTQLLENASAAGRRTADGLSMLIGQARPSFEAFYGRPPSAETDMRAHLISHLGQGS
jgi:shikimate dehydrogenase